MLCAKRPDSFILNPGRQPPSFDPFPSGCKTDGISEPDAACQETERGTRARAYAAGEDACLSGELYGEDRTVRGQPSRGLSRTTARGVKDGPHNLFF